jgi:tetratricopeptide (TPR) repeat protein
MSEQDREPMPGGEDEDTRPIVRRDNKPASGASWDEETPIANPMMLRTRAKAQEAAPQKTAEAAPEVPQIVMQPLGALVEKTATLERTEELDLSKFNLPDFSPIVAERVKLLSAAIERYPDAPVNYVLRGELYLNEGYFAEAADDFRRGLALAEAKAEAADWGYVSQGLADRARQGLRKC